MITRRISSPERIRPGEGETDIYTCGLAVRRFQGVITIILIILILMLIGALPTWPHSARWGYGPSGGLGTVLIILLILYLLHVI